MIQQRLAAVRLFIVFVLPSRSFDGTVEPNFVYIKYKFMLQWTNFKSNRSIMFSEESSTPQHEIVKKRIGEIRLSEKILYFPGEPVYPALNTTDYLGYLLLLQKRLYDAQKPANYFDELILGCSDGASALSALIKYQSQESKPFFPFKILTLDLEHFSVSDADIFVENFLTLITQLSQRGVSTLRFANTASLSNIHIQKIVTWIEANPDIALDLTLPLSHQTSAYQQQLDLIFATRARNHLNNTFKRQSEIFSFIQIPYTPRTRPRIQASATIDVQQEREQERQDQIQVEIKDHEQLDWDPNLDRTSLDYYTIESFAEAWQLGMFPEDINSHYYDSSKEHAYAIWCNLTGAFNRKDAQTSNVVISKAAAHEFVRQLDGLFNSLDIDFDQKRPSPGFLIKRSDTQKTFHYHRQLKSIVSHDPLTVIPSTASEAKPLLTHQEVKLLLANQPFLKQTWEKLNQTPYDKKANIYFRQSLLTLLLLEPSALQNLISMSQRADGTLDGDQFEFLLKTAQAIHRSANPPRPGDTNLTQRLERRLGSAVAQKALQFIFDYDEHALDLHQHDLDKLLQKDDLELIQTLLENYPYLKLEGLFNLYLQFGTPGLNQFGGCLQVYSDTCAIRFASHQDYTSCFKKEEFDALKTIDGIKQNPQEYHWWKQLFEQHCKTNKHIDLAELVHAFKEFKGNASKSLSENLTFTEGTQADFLQSNNLIRTLSRADQLLKHCDSYNRRAQWGELPHLNYSSRGMIKALSTQGPKRWAFIPKEARIDPHEEAYSRPHVTYYEAPAQCDIVVNLSALAGRNLRLIPDNDEIQGYLQYDDLCYRPTNQGYQIEWQGGQKLFSSDTPWSGFQMSYDDHQLLPEALGNHQLRFISTNDLKGLGFRGAPLRYNGHNIHFKKQLPALDDPTYLHQFIYVAPHLYFIASPRDAVQVAIKPDFEQKIKDRIQNHLKKQKYDYLINLINKKFNHPPLRVINTLRELMSLKNNNSIGTFYVFIKDTQKVFLVWPRSHREIPLSQIDPQGLLTQFDVQHTKSWFFSTDFFTSDLLKNESLSLFAEICPPIGLTRRPTDVYFIDSTIKQFFRYAAYQNQRGGTSLEIYQYAHQKLQEKQASEDKFSNELVCLMYQNLGSLLSDCNEFCQNEQEIKAYIDEVVAYTMPLMKRVKFWTLGVSDLFTTIDSCRINVLLYVAMLKPRPPLPFFNNIIKFYAANFENIMHTENFINHAFCGYNNDARKQNIYQGMRDYTNEDFDQKDDTPIEDQLFIRHFKSIFSLKELESHVNKRLANYHDSETITDYLIGLISTFQINLQCDVKGLNLIALTVPRDIDKKSCHLDPLFRQLLAYFDNKKSDVLLKILSILSKINFKKSGQTQRPTQEDLYDILSMLEDENADAVYERLQHFQCRNGQYLCDFFPNQTLPIVQTDYTIPEEVQLKLREFFTTTPQRLALEEFLTQFREAEHYEHTVNLLINICKDLTAQEQTVFLNKLLAAKGLYTPIDSLHPQRSCFVKLLQEVYQNKHQNLFNYFIETEQQLLQKSTEPQKSILFAKQGHQTYIPDLAERMLFFAKRIQPTLQTKTQPAISALELTPRIIEICLKTAIGDLRQADESARLTLDLSDMLDTLVRNNPGVKKQFLELFDKILENYSPENQEKLLPYLTNLIQDLETSFKKIQDKNIAISLCLFFKQNTGEFTPENLMNILKIAKDKSDNGEDYNLYLRIVVTLLGENPSYDQQKFEQLCQLSLQNPAFKKLLREDYYNHAPYPTLDQVLSWDEAHREEKDSTVYQEKMRADYHRVDLNPTRRDTENGFDSETASKQLALFKCDYSPIEQNLINVDDFYRLTMRLRSETTDDLLKQLQEFSLDSKSYNPALAPNYDLLIALNAELLYRSQGIELNTTQYLALLLMLKTGKHVTNEQETGEGKTRVMMTLCACFFAMGKTVDFVTSDLYLATRDFVAFQPYFNLIGAISRLIFSDSPSNVYKIGGINFSDTSNLALFRNQARSRGEDALVIDRPEQRVHLGDESDKRFYEANRRFNISSTSDELIRDMPWIYSLLMMYFSQPYIEVNGKKVSPFDLFYDDIDLCRETFIQFVYKDPICTPENKLRLQALSQAKIEEWQAMAVVAKQQVFKTHFDIFGDQLTQTDHGLKMSSRVMLILSSEIDEKSKLSFGGHQCLEQEMNRLRENPDANNDPALKEDLAKCEYPFESSDEKQIIYSSTNKNLLDDYKEGYSYHVTGTAGSPIKRAEVYLLHGSKSADAEHPAEPMHFIDVPRHRGFHRRDKALYLASNEQRQLEQILKTVQQAEAQGRSVLIFTENQKENDAFTKYLQQHLQTSQIQQAHAKLSFKEKQHRIKQAGCKKQITLATDVFGRGIHIELEQAVKDAGGLLVINTFLSDNQEDEIQRNGRAGRYGDPGEAINILNKEKIKKKLTKQTLTDGFYTHTEDYILNELTKIERQTQLQRLISHTIGDFRKKLTDNFFIECLPYVRHAHAEVLPLWSKFFALSDQVWNTIEPQIQVILAQKPLSIEKVETLLQTYHDKIQAHWNKFSQEFDALKLATLHPKTHAPLSSSLKLQKVLPEIELTEDIKKLMSYILPDLPLKKIKAYDHYDEAHDGRAVKYTNWSIPLMASLKGWANLIPGVHFESARRPFANFRAWTEGRGQLLADFRASENKAAIALIAVTGLLALASGISFLLLELWLQPIFCYTLIAAGGALVLSVTSGSVGRVLDDLTDSSSETRETRNITSWKQIKAHLQQPARPSVKRAVAPKEEAIQENKATAASINKKPKSHAPLGASNFFTPHRKRPSPATAVPLKPHSVNTVPHNIIPRIKNQA